jgi:CDP-glucose 4,6-dehydratase
MKLNILNTYAKKKVLVTGHTGFKGSWLTQWLLLIDAEVFGYALAPPTTPSLFNQLELVKHCENNINDVRNFEALKKYIGEVKPDIIFHLAAQSLVRESYKNPIETIETNINGTANVLEAVRQLKLSTIIVVITSDKCYENKEWLHGYRENDSMGGYDPYSMSKGAAELVVSSWRRSFFNVNEYSNHGVKLASARAGNVIGGGDWADDRIVPDCMRSLQKEEEIFIRNPFATRPWQHVLESLGGYLILGAKLMGITDDEMKTYCSGFNFGPLSSSNKSVEILVKEILSNWGRGTWTYKKEDTLHEAFLLNLNIDKAYHLLKWQPVWSFESTVENTVDWYKTVFENPDNISNITGKQITEYSKSLMK